MEGTLLSLLRSVKERAARPAAAAAVGPGGEAAADGEQCGWQVCTAQLQVQRLLLGIHMLARMAACAALCLAEPTLRLRILPETLFSLLTQASCLLAVCGVVAGAVVAVAAAGEVELPEGELEALGDAVGGDEDDDDEHGGRFDLKKLQTSLSENINRCGGGSAATVQRAACKY